MTSRTGHIWSTSSLAWVGDKPFFSSALTKRRLCSSGSLVAGTADSAFVIARARNPLWLLSQRRLRERQSGVTDGGTGRYRTNVTRLWEFQTPKDCDRGMQAIRRGAA
jgi:hypothetical protein